MKKLSFAIFLSFISCCVILVGCSGSSTSPVAPGDAASPTLTGDISHEIASHDYILGYYDIQFDPETMEFEAVANRTAEFTLNIVPFLNKMMTPVNGITFDSIVIHNDDPAFFGVDLEFSVYHPFPGYDQYQAYDMRGVVIGDGADSLQYGGLNVARHGADLWMKNPDGYTRWFNPTDFTSELIFGYAPGGWQNYKGNAQLNPYKYYSKHLGKDDNLWSYLTEDVNYEGIFESGSGRTMELEFPLPPAGIGIMFGYAVVVAWEDQGPTGPFSPYHVAEAVAANITQTPDVWFDGTSSGGSLILDAELFGWEYQPSIIKIESTVTDGIAEFDAGSIGTPVSEHVSSYHVEVVSKDLSSAENHYGWLIAEYDGFDYANGLPEIPHADGPLAAFFRYDIEVVGGPGNLPPTCDLIITDPVAPPYENFGPIDMTFDSGAQDPNQDYTTLSYEWDFDGDGLFWDGTSGDSDDVWTGDAWTPTHTYTESGNPTITVRITDDYSEMTECSVGPIEILIGSCGDLTCPDSLDPSYNPIGRMYYWGCVSTRAASTPRVIACGSIQQELTAINPVDNDTVLIDNGGNLYAAVVDSTDRVYLWDFPGDMQLVYRDWNDSTSTWGARITFGTALPSDGNSWRIWRLSIDENDNPVVFSRSPVDFSKGAIFHWGGSDWNSIINVPASIMTSCGSSYQNVNDMDYNPYDGGSYIISERFDWPGMHAFKADGTVLFSEDSVFGAMPYTDYRPVCYIDIDSPDCRMIFVAGSYHGNAPSYFARFNPSYGEKTTSNFTVQYTVLMGRGTVMDVDGVFSYVAPSYNPDNYIIAPLTDW